MLTDKEWISRILAYKHCVPLNHIPKPITKSQIYLDTKKSRKEFKEYVVLDFETTGFSPKNDKIIEVGLARYEKNKEVATFSTLVNPQMAIPSQITDLTGITNSDVKSAPTISEIIHEIRDFIADSPVVAYNAPFDISFLETAYKDSGISTDLRYLDALPLARETFPEMEDHRLSTLIDSFCLSEGQTHRALDDVRCTQKLLVLCFAELDTPHSTPRNVPKVERKAPKEDPVRSHSRRHFENVKISDIHQTAEYINSDNPLYGKSVVFTGELSIDRKEAMQIAVNAGAVVRSAISRKTDYLVVGSQDKTLVGDDGLSSKEEKAYDLNSKGEANIQIICEAEFISLATIEDFVNEQITLIEFESTNEHERSALLEILPRLETAATSMGASKEKIEIRHGKAYSSVKYGSVLAFRLRLRGTNRYIEVPAASRELVAGIAPAEQQKDVASGFWRIDLLDEPVSNHAAALAAVLQDAINRLPKEWDCCSRYMECSDAKKCIHPDSTFALGCGYRKILASGKIYYGKNRNID